jgi:AraC family transcriptional regulator
MDRFSTSCTLQPDIVRPNARKLLGMRLRMSLRENKTALLWQAFMPRRNEIAGLKAGFLISATVYDTPFRGDPDQTFDKWATVEVEQLGDIPTGMETLTIPAGLYAVFHYKGNPADATVFRYIFSQWLPASGYRYDHRPQFEILGPKYRNNHEDSEEEIWIPLKE